MDPNVEEIQIENEIALAKAKRYAEFLHDLDLYERSLLGKDSPEETVAPLVQASDRVGEG
jgi:hypothetical protein